MKLSVVATLYRSAPYIPEFHRRASAAARELVGEDYEIVLVNDGSPDDSLELAIALSQADEHVVVVDLSRNFGHHKAMKAGLEYSRGEQVFLIDSDLEEEPEWLLTFANRMASEKSDVVFGVQVERKGDWFERWSGALHYTILDWLLNIDHPRNITTTRLMSRRYVDALLTHREVEMVISCLWVITGFRQIAMPVVKHAKKSTTYGISRKVSHLVNAITSFSEAPLRMIFYCGASVFVGAIVYAAVLTVKRIFMSQPVDGWTSIMVSVWLLGGMIMSFIGIIGIYLSKIYSETKQRPYVIVREVHGKSER